MPTKEINEFHVVDTIEKTDDRPRVLLENKTVNSRP